MLALVWGVIPIHGEQAGSLEDRFDGAVKAAREAGYLKDGDEVILTGGTAGSVPGSGDGGAYREARFAPLSAVQHPADDLHGVPDLGERQVERRAAEPD